MIPDCSALRAPAIFNTIRNPLIFFKNGFLLMLFRVPSSKLLPQASLRRRSDLCPLGIIILYNNDPRQSTQKDLSRIVTDKIDQITFSLLSKSSCYLIFRSVSSKASWIGAPGDTIGYTLSSQLIWHSMSTGACNAMASSRTGFKSSCLVTR